MLDIIRLGFSEPVPGGDRHEEFGLPPGPVEYRRGWDLQREIHADVLAGRRPDTFLLLEHQAVYTAGKMTKDHERPRDHAPVVDVDRGGKITWHGPQQLVGYPIVRLPAPVNVVGFVRALERTLIEVCARFGVPSEPVEGRSGVWVRRPGEEDRKIAAIGMRVSKRTTMHGFALNCANDLSWAQNVIPCGIDDAGVTSLSSETGRDIRVADVLEVIDEPLRRLVADRTAGRDEQDAAARGAGHAA
ncbi:lipoyl(octanoyl) transferase LipB [Brachybacterium sp. EF45031]|uniref:lipoyl(octanoyl) transferase LipB n=1 Tax=Brachybacterium sillae TaxID=2810536 RepID=UPI00217CCB06|nr:lipoyl(octanoyl) transferase LipB [Brachybacterium sillae]MCS6710715.1 lipoyl(octanoyl) transferase LipB [Brachybacterium sillae]